jgi:hypothetical protein
MKKLFIVITALLLAACNNPSGHQETKMTNDNQEYFPVTSFLSGQVNMVDSLQLPVLRFTTINGVTDTVLLSIAEFRALAQEFLKPDFSELHEHYTEAGFADQSIPSVTLTYSTPDKALELKRVDVIIDPKPEFGDKVKSIYMEKIIHKDDTLITKKLYWKTNKNFQIITSKQTGELPAINSHIKVSWDQMEN